MQTPMTPIQMKIKAVSDLFEMAVRIKTHQLKKRFPQASEAEIKARVIQSIERGTR